jgi:hypothetical protein
MPKAKHLLKEQILMAMKNTKSNRAAARFLNCSYTHYKMWAKRYNEFDGGRTLFDVHYNQKGVGIAKWGNVRKKKSIWSVLDVVEGRVSHTHFKPQEIKKRMIEESILKEECAMCGFNDRRLTDYKMPLILNFKDNNPTHYNLGNIRFLCYNCYFINHGDIFNKQDINQLETHVPTNGTTEAIDFQLDDYQLAQLEKLGLYQPPKAEDDGSEFISRI